MALILQILVSIHRRYIGLRSNASLEPRQGTRADGVVDWQWLPRAELRGLALAFCNHINRHINSTWSFRLCCKPDLILVYQRFNRVACHVRDAYLLADISRNTRSLAAMPETGSSARLSMRRPRSFPPATICVTCNLPKLRKREDQRIFRGTCDEMCQRKVEMIQIHREQRHVLPW